MEVYIFADNVQAGLAKMDFRSLKTASSQNPLQKCQSSNKNCTNQAHKQDKTKVLILYIFFYTFGSPGSTPKS